MMPKILKPGKRRASAMRKLSFLLGLAGVIGIAAEPAHPSLLFTAEDLPAIRQKLKQAWLPQAYGVLKGRAEQMMQTPTSPYPLFGVVCGKATVGRAINVYVTTLGFIGLVEGDRRYLDKAAAIVLSAIAQSSSADYESWNDHLAVADAAHAYAVAYDWLYPTLSPEQRAQLRAEVEEFGRWLWDRSTGGKDLYGKFEPMPLSCNHQAMMHGGLGFCALALGGQEAWLERATKYIGGYFHYSMDDTGYSYEGLGYCGYGHWGSIPFAVALKRSGGPDLIAAAPKLRLVSRYTLYQLAPWGGEAVAMNDSGFRPDNPAGLMRLSADFQDRLGLWTWLRYYGPEGDGSYGASPTNYFGDAGALPYTLLFADPALSPHPPAEAKTPTFQIFESGRASFRSDWGPLSAFSTFTCGFDQHRGHNHRDENSFTFFARGEKFVIDPGYQPKETRSHNTLLVDGQGQGPDAGVYDVCGRMLGSHDFGSACGITGEAADAFPRGVGLDRARRSLLFVSGPNPYVVISDDYKKKSGEAARYSWLLHTDRSNRITIDQAGHSALIQGARRKGLCRVQFLNPHQGLEIEESNLKDLKVKSLGTEYRLERFYRELQASVSAVNPRFVAILNAADDASGFIRLKSEGGPEKMTVEVSGNGDAIEILTITPEGIDYRKLP